MVARLLIFLSLLGFASVAAKATTLEAAAGIFVGHRIERLTYPTREVRHYKEISIYEADGTYWTRLERDDGEVFVMTGSLSFDADGSWISNDGPHFRANLRGNALIVYIDWHRYGIPAVVQSMTHRVDALPGG